MKKETLYIWIIAVLFLVNAAQLGVFLIKPKPPMPPRNEQHQGFRERAVELLNLSEIQREQFYKLSEKHAAEIEALNKKEKTLTTEYFDNPTELGLQAILKIQSQKIKVTQEHFNEIKSIITKSQKSDFEKFKKEAIQHIIR